MTELYTELSRVDPLIIPVFNIKELSYMSFHLARHMINNPKTKLLIISLDKGKEEHSLSDLPAIFQSLGVHEFARRHPEIKVIMGYPDLLYKLPINELAIYHFQNLEVRLIEVEEMKVVKNYVYEDGSLEEFLESKEEGEFAESAAPKFPEIAEFLSPTDYNDRVIKGNDCWFVMNCSKDCSACH
jgi:hypothetical protein